MELPGIEQIIKSQTGTTSYGGKFEYLDDGYARQADQLLIELRGKQLTTAEKIQLAGVYSNLSLRHTLVRLVPRHSEP